jgi:hypothetical protein
MIYFFLDLTVVCLNLTAEKSDNIHNDTGASQNLSLNRILPLLFFKLFTTKTLRTRTILRRDDFKI